MGAAVETMNATDFKTHCLKVLDEVSRNRREFVVTKRGKPVAKVCPVHAGSGQAYGCMKGTALAKDDLFSTHEEWDVEK
jgi:prevent-host-death family protein